MPLPPLRFRASALLTVAVAAALVVGALGGCASQSVAPSAAPATTSASPTPPPPPPTTLLSGRVGRDHRVLAVKIDNTVNSHPQSGLMSADLVYLEEVEWGLTRMVAVFSSRYPKTVGPVRSARVTDIDLLHQFGKVAFAYAGATGALKPFLAAAPLYQVSSDLGPAGYRRSSDRIAPWNLYASPKALLRRAPRAQKPRDVGFTFAKEVPPGGRPVKSVTVTWPSSIERFRWSPKAGRWLLWTDGAKAMSTEGPQLGGTTVIVQLADVYPSVYGDKFGGVTPMTETVGRGKALVLRNGRVYHVDWVRHSAAQGTRWLYRGSDLPMAPGQVWIALLDNDRRPTLR